MKKKDVLNKLKGQLIVSCQALPDEPLHSSFIMNRMARAALEGGAGGIRSNSVEDIQAILQDVSLPLIGIIKAVSPSSEVFITPTEKEVEELVACGTDIIAMDATQRIRPDGRVITELFPLLKEKYPNQLFMADCSSLEDAKIAEELGFDVVGTTLYGYTEETKDQVPPNFDLVKQMLEVLTVPIIAEGGIWFPEQLRKMMDLGVFAVVVGTAITRPREITQHFLKALNPNE